jgi:Putative Flp pilus-assembly TadE/G-like
MHRLLSVAGRFRRDGSGNIAVIFTIALLPVFSAVGCAVDYSMATRMRAKLEAAADAASVAAISRKSAGYTAAAAMTGNGPVSAGVTEANAVFDGNMSAVTGYANLTRTSTVTKTGIERHVQRGCPDDVHESGWLPEADRDRLFKFGRLAAALSRFLSHAGRFGIDGVAVNDQRSPADAGGQSG